MNILVKLMSISIIVLIVFTLLNNNIDISFAKDQIKNSFVNKNLIPICCTWGIEMKGGILTYSFNGGDKKVENAVKKAIDSWNKNLKGLEFEKTNSDGNIIISFTNDGKKVAGKTVNSIDSNGFIRKSYVTLSKKSFNRQFSPTEIELVAKHEFGHVLGLNHANFNGNLMTSQVNKGSGTISSCVIEAVKTANEWKLKEGGVSIHKPTKSYVIC
ncbi:MAG TPA: M57 family metalloprotease [Candidatus Sulfopaludibacter sp.]|jgi:hypothetical protein|nr:M57 family metalloprotease [Candidatus Sulfopaludibacter sp.]